MINLLQSKEGTAFVKQLVQDKRSAVFCDSAYRALYFSFRFRNMQS